MTGRRKVAARVALLSVSMLALVASTAFAGAPAGAPDVRTGRRAGPIPVKVTNRPGTIATVPLTAGNWTVLVKGVVRVIDPVNTPHPVRCKLTVGGRSDALELRPEGGNASSSTVPFLAVKSAHLFGAGDAVLKCNAPGSTAGQVVAERIYASAFKTSALRQIGAVVVDFGSQSSTSRVVEDTVLVGATVPSAAPVAIVGSFPLPSSGPWAVTATATLAGAGNASGTVTCRLAISPGGDQDEVQQSIGSSATDKRSIALHSVAQVPSAATVFLRCGTSGGAATITDIRFTAFRLQTLHSLVMAPIATVPIAADAPQPRVAAGFQDGPSTIPVLANQFLKVAGLRLPKGKWVVAATTMIKNTSATDTATVLCSLGGGVAGDLVKLQLNDTGFSDNLQPLTNLMRVNLTSQAEVNLLCRSDTTGTKASDISIVAYRVGAMTEVALD